MSRRPGSRSCRAQQLTAERLPDGGKRVNVLEELAEDFARHHGAFTLNFKPDSSFPWTLALDGDAGQRSWQDFTAEAALRFADEDLSG